MNLPILPTFVYENGDMWVTPKFNHMHLLVQTIQQIDSNNYIKISYSKNDSYGPYHLLDGIVTVLKMIKVTRNSKFKMVH